MFDDTGRYPSTNLECSITTFDYRVAPPQVCIPEWLPSRCQNVAAGDPALRLGFASLSFFAQETTEEPLNIHTLLIG